MKKLRTVLMAAALACGGFAATAHAEVDGAGMAPGCGPHRQADPIARTEEHLARFKAALKVAPGQETAWADYASKVRAAVKGIEDESAAARREIVSTAPARLDRHIALLRARLKGFERIDAALKELYVVLTPDQRQVADDYFANRRG